MDSDPSSFINAIDFNLFFGILGVVFLLLCSAYISGSEVALFSLDQKDLDDLEANDSSIGKQISNLLSKPKKLLATILIANNFINIGIVILFSTINEKIFGGISSKLIQFLLEVILLTFLILLFGEVLPKIYASRNNVVFSKKVSIPISVLNRILSPISVPMRNIILFIEKKFSVQKSNFSVDQLSQALELTDHKETTSDEQKILEGIVTFGNTDVKQVMSPRIDIFALEYSESFNEIMPIIIEKGYSRIPVYKDGIDHIEGVLFIKDLIPYIDYKDFEWQTLLRAPFFVPENKKLDNLLKEFQGMKNHLAIVVDEYGGTSGLVSLEDILEEIVGDISDEFDDIDISFTKINDKNYLFDGKVSLKDFYRVVDVNEEKFENAKGEAETLAGFLLEISGNFPKKSSQIIFDTCKFTIENIDKRRIKQVKITLD
ncbi:gliding motility-associated protein GldE [uncultured Flavobacterium sp.]|uniref:gliding motility-associated protein GldE n=1 Tax=uncultured Flavobacterium sp. TaxID=165435 RepID=UPI0030CA215B